MKPVIEFDSIFDFDTFPLDLISDTDYITLKTDYKGDKEGVYNYDFWNKRGKVYNKEEIASIRNTLYEHFVSRVCIPPDGVKDKQKIIYAQIVLNLSKITEYDFEGFKLIDENREIYYDCVAERRADETQNLKGLMKGKSVCGGYAAIINALANYYGISSRMVIGMPEEEDGLSHAWNVLALDGGRYEDDFTWYMDELRNGNIPHVSTFLRGSIQNKRVLSELNLHQTNNMQVPDLSPEMPTTVKRNLLLTDWENITNWEDVDLKITNGLDSFVNQLEDWAVKIKYKLRLTAQKLKGVFDDREL